MVDFSRAPIAAQEAALTERLRKVFPPAIFQIRRVPQIMSAREFERLANETPLIGLAWVGARPNQTSQRVFKGTQGWRLMLFYRASNGLEARFKGDVKGWGLDAMVDVASALMHGWSIDTIGTVTVTNTNSLTAEGLIDDNLAMATVDIDITFSSSPSDFGIAGPDDFETVTALWTTSGSPLGLGQTINIP